MPGKRYENYVQKGRPLWKIITGFLFSNVGMFFLNILFACIGAAIFIKIELPAEESRKQLKLLKNNDVEDALKYLKTIFWVYATSPVFNFTSDQFQSKVVEDLNTLKLFIVNYNTNYWFDFTDNWTYSWTFPKALLFTLTIITTIGYGHIVPKTTMGKMFCVIYSIIGIPVLLLYMAHVGDKMGDAFRYAYSRVFCRWCRVRRRDAEAIGDVEKPKVSQDEIGKETYMPSDMVNVPVMVCLLLIFVYLFIGAFAFSSWEDNWSLGAALYFCFISLTTIGFGDLVPLKSFLHYADGLAPFLKMLFTMLYIVFGIAMLSMCIQLMQEGIMTQIQALVKSVGIGNNNQEEELVKVSKTERLKQTPSDMTGNELDFNEKRKKKNMRIRAEERPDLFFEENDDGDDSDF